MKFKKPMESKPMESIFEQKTMELFHRFHRFLMDKKRPVSKVPSVLKFLGFQKVPSVLKLLGFQKVPSV